MPNPRDSERIATNHRPAMSARDLDAIDADAVFNTLAAIRYARAPRDDALLRLTVLDGHARAAGIELGAAGRAWALESLLTSIVTVRLAALRGAPPGEDFADVDAAAEVDRLTADFAAGNPSREAWGVLFSRFLSTNALTVEGLAADLGITRRTLARRVRSGCELLAKQLRAAEVMAVQATEHAAAPRVDPPILVASHAAPRTADDAALSVLAAVRGEADTALLRPSDARGLAQADVADLSAYRLGRIAAWSGPRFRLDRRFVQLTLLVDRGSEDAAGRWRASAERFDDLGEVLAAVDDPAIVLLGPPGSGKSTLLQRFELDVAAAGLRGETDMVPFHVPLARYRARRDTAAPPAPRSWLATAWSARFPALGTLKALVAEGRLLLLLDGLNEMPHTTTSEYTRRVLAWKRFVQDVAASRPGNRIVFSCRSLDYSAVLSTPALPVPQVRVEALDDDSIRAFVRRYAPEHADDIATAMRDPARRTVFRSPYLLRLLVESWASEGPAGTHPAALFTGVVRRALGREVGRDNPLFAPGELLSERDVARLAQNVRWRTRYELPERGPLIPTLARLAHDMQSQSAEAERAGVRVDYDTALSMIGGDPDFGEDLVRAGEAIGVLDEDREQDEVLFAHHLLQEYFAARHFARWPIPSAAHVGWRSAEVAAPSTVLDSLPPSEPLPALPASGWEETVHLAAVMTEDVDAFVAGMSAHNLPLAGVIAGDSEIFERLSAATVRRLRDELVARARDPAADVRARVAAGLALGTLGDPRLVTGTSAHGEFLIGPLVGIGAGDYFIGIAVPFDYLGKPMTHNTPGGIVHLAAFHIGAFPVTNAEFARFIAAGGYEESEWWDAPIAADWRIGIDTAEGHRSAVRFWWRWFRADPSRIDAQHAAGEFTDEHHALWKSRVGMDAATLDADLRETYPDEVYRAPRYWDDPVWNNPAQPVVGVSWPEARAYCRWLSACTGSKVRLPTEAEWEAAARGLAGRPYGCGEDFDLEIGNTQPLRLRRTTPVGVFPTGDTPEGVSDLAGNTWDWTVSLWGTDTTSPTYRYPYDPSDGREDESAPKDACRIVRGGSWVNGPMSVRADFRGFEHPFDRTNLHGFRVVVED